MTSPEYHYSHLMETIWWKNTKGLDTHTFSIINDGSGPCTCYRNCFSLIQEFHLRVNYDGRVFNLSHLSKPPYLVGLSQDNKNAPAHLVVYREGPGPELEYEGTGRLTGIVLAYSCDPYKNNQTLVSALYSPVANHVITSVESDFSLAAERNFELCTHILLYADAVLWMMEHGWGGDSQ